MMRTNIAGILLFLLNGVHCIPLNDFFEYGGNARERSTSLGNNNLDADSGVLHSGELYMFYGIPINALIVSENGGITLCPYPGFPCDPVLFTANPLPLNEAGFGLLGVFWADADLRETGDVWYHQSDPANSNTAVLNKINTYIELAFMQDGFAAKEFMIVTWEKVGYFDRNSDKTNTFQCVLATDGTLSYAIYLYADDMIQWITVENDGGGGGLGGIPAWVGINKGDGIEFLSIAGARTDSIISIAEGNNIQVPSSTMVDLPNTEGVYVIRISDGAVPTTCVHDGVENGIGELVQINCTTRCVCESTGNLNCTSQPCTINGPSADEKGDPHYDTFDSLKYDYQGLCEYVITKPCNSDDFVISARNRPCNERRTGVSCVQFVRITVPNENIEIKLERVSRQELGRVTINRTVIPNTGDGNIYLSETIDVNRSGGNPYVLLKTFGIRISWNGRYHYVKVTPASFNSGQLCGLLGTYNGDSSDDLRKPDGTIVTDINEFGDSWLIPDATTPGCEGTPGISKRDAGNTEGCSIDPAVVSEAQELCSFITQDPFTPCNNVVDPSSFIANCEFDYCCTNETERQEFVCGAYASFAGVCAEAGVTISSWRLFSGCSTLFPCPTGMVYQQCGSLCPQTCGNFDQVCEGGCADGCFCPVGKVLLDGECLEPSRCTACVLMDVIYQQGEEIQPNCSTRCVCQNREFVCETVPCVADGATCTVSGYSHYQTFDLQSFTFQGDCEYILTTPCDSDEFTITVQSGAHDQFVACVHQVNITTANTEIILGRDDYVTVNGKNKTQDYDGVISASSALQVLRVGGNTHVILLAQNIRIFWDGLYRVEVTVSTTWQNRLCGLCGNYNGDNTDDGMTPDGSLVTNVNILGTSWITGNTSNCGALPSAPFCLGEARINAINICNSITQNVFTDCNAAVDPTHFLFACIFDYCNCHASQMECFCDSLASYASACSRAGVVLSTWRDRFCSVQCPTGATYHQCGPLCPQSCDSTNETCYGGCAEGCFCNEGQVMNDLQECVTTELCPILGCHRSRYCNDASITIQASSATECCELGGKSYDDGSGCITACGLIEGDPHFTVPLLSKEILCYSIQGYSGLAFNLIYNKDFIINAMFVNTEGDTSEATWIGKLAVIPHNTNKSNVVIFDSVNQEVEMIGQGILKAAMVKKIVITESGRVKFTETVQKQSGNPVIHVVYTKPQAKFDVTFYNNHLNVDWRMNYDEFHDSHGLMGQFMKKGVDIDAQREMLIYSDGRDPVPVIKDTVMTGKLCWKATNYGYQGEGLIEGNILDYVVPHIADVADNLKKLIKPN